MFLLPSVFLGLAVALLLGGKPARILEVRFRLPWLVVIALLDQVFLFSRLGAAVPDALERPLHLASYGLLIAFAAANLHIRPLVPVLLGMFLNALAITVNGGHMPVSASAAEAVGLPADGRSNISEAADRLTFLGDIFALPSRLPLANVFSIGDLLIGFGMVAFIVIVSVGEGRERALSPSRLLEPLRTPDYRRLAAARLVSHLGDWLTLAALIGWIYGATGSTGHVVGLMLARLAPPILGGSVAALFVDRVAKQRLLLWVELARGIAVAGALAGVLAGVLPAVFAALVLSGALAAVSGAAVPALLPSLLPPAQLSSANAGLGIAKDAAMALGALGAGVALASVGPTWALAANLVTFAGAAVLYRGLRSSGAAVWRERRRDAPSGLRYLLGRRRLLLLVLSFAAATLATGLTNATLPRFLDQELGFGPGAYGFGMAALAGGLALGQALVGFARVGATSGRWIGVGLVLMSALFIMLGLAEHGGTVLLLLGAIGFLDGTTDVLFETVVQRDADPRYYGCVFGFASAFVTTTMLAAVSLAPMANQILPSREVILGAGVFLVAAGVIGLAGMWRSARLPSLAAAESR